MSQHAAARPLPRISPESRPFWEATRQGRLVLQKCNHCGRFFYPISPACPYCLSDDFTWTEVSGRGRVMSWIVYHKVFFPAFADRIPYNVAHVELEEGPRLTANILECRNEDIAMGMPVEACFEKVTDEITLVQFRPARSRGKG